MRMLTRTFRQRMSVEKGRAMATTATTVFLDRDGVINRNRDDYVKGWGEFAFLPGAREAIADLTRAGRRLFVVTNQACVGKGLATLAAIEDIHRRMLDELARAGGHIEAVLMCPHRADEGCGCRKPAPGLLLQAREVYGADLSRAVFVGDGACDMRLAAAVGMDAILALTGLGEASAAALLAEGAAPATMRTARDLREAARLITRDLRDLTPAVPAIYDVPGCAIGAEVSGGIEAPVAAPWA